MDDAVRFQPAALDQTLAHAVPAGYGPHRCLFGLDRSALSQPRRRPSPPTADRVVLGEDLAAGSAPEPSFPEQHVHHLVPEVGVLLALLPPLMHLACRTRAVRTRHLLGLVARHDFDRPGVLAHAQDLQPRELQLHRDSLRLHLVSFPLLTFSSAVGYGNPGAFLFSLLLCIHT